MSDHLEALPSMDKRDLYNLVEIWLQTFDRIRGGDAARGLIRLGEYLNFSNLLLPWLTSRALDEKLLAIMALGLLQERRALPVIRNHIDNSYPLLSLAAMKAFMDIAPEEGLPELIRRIDTPGWPMGRIRQLLADVPRQLQTQYLVLAAETLPQEQLPQLLELVFALAPSEASELVHICLSRCPHHEPLLRTILKNTADPQFLSLARISCQSTTPDLRSDGLLALGRLGEIHEQARLIHHLNNDIWLNQQAAAKSLFQLIHDPVIAQHILRELRTESAQQHWSELLFDNGWLLNRDATHWLQPHASSDMEAIFHG